MGQCVPTIWLSFDVELEIIIALAIETNLYEFYPIYEYMFNDSVNDK